MLENKKITLRAPSNWTDETDQELIDIYKHHIGEKGLTAMCFTSKIETSHHWRIFANRSAEACITFNARQLIEMLPKDIIHGLIDCYSEKDLKIFSDQIKIGNIPL
jgi:hypothetical protein